MIGLASSIIKNVVTERWAKSRNQVACVPADVEHSFPYAYAQTAAHPVPNDALLKTFVEEYVHLTQNEQIINYHKISSDGRYQNDFLSTSRQKAIEMALPDSPEFALNKLKFAQSYDVFQTLRKAQAGWVFNIDDILIFPGPNTGIAIAVIRGEFQVVYDRAVVPGTIQDELWGYREIILELYQRPPLKDLKGDNLNKYGIFVGRSEMYTLSSDQRQQRLKRGYEYYMKGNE